MTLLMLKLSSLMMAILALVMAGAVWIGSGMPAHLLAFTLIRDDSFVYIAHVERGMSLRAGDIPIHDPTLRVSPQGEFLFYRGYLGGEGNYVLVDLRTWETMLLPPSVNDLRIVDVHWELEDHRIRLSHWTSNDTTDHYSLDLETGVLEETEVISTLPVMMRQSLLPGGIIGINADGEPTLTVTLDEDNLPRLVDYSFDEPLPPFTSFSRILPFSLSPDDQYFAAVLNLSGRDDLYLVPAWEGEPINLTNNNADERNPTWSPDGCYIAYLSMRRNLLDLHVMDVEQNNFYIVAIDDDFRVTTPIVWIP